MDCKTARALIDFARPNALELEPRDAADLDSHLKFCPECGAAAHAERAEDECFGRAMRQVLVPEPLRKILLARLDAERGEWYRYRIGHVVRVAAIAAALLVAIVGVVRWVRPGPASIDADRAIDQLVQIRLAPTAEKVQEAIVQLPSDAPAPANLLYTHLAAPPALANFQGKRVPMLVFVHRDDQRAGSDRAVVYLLSKHDFDVKNLPANFASAGSFNYRIDVVSQDADHAYLVIHTGTDWNWLRASAGE